MQRMRRDWLLSAHEVVKYRRQLIPCVITVLGHEVECAIYAVPTGECVHVRRVSDGQCGHKPVHYSRLQVTDDIAQELEAMVAKVQAMASKWDIDICTWQTLRRSRSAAIWRAVAPTVALVQDE